MTDRVDWSFNLEAGADVVAAVLPGRPETMAGWTPHGIGRLTVGALIRAGWVLVPPVQGRAPCPPPAWLADLIQRRERARAQGDFATADALRAQAATRGYSILDTRTGTVWEAARGTA